jgi:hypothetical protein
LTGSRAFGLILSAGHSPATAPDAMNALAAKAPAKIVLRLMVRDVLLCVMSRSPLLRRLENVRPFAIAQTSPPGSRNGNIGWL